jgi:tRNA uridine 5-carbamoylmethylation protein Kti12
MNVVDTLNINLWAAPGVGKSTVAAQLFSTFKMSDLSCELVREYAKDLMWDGKLAEHEQLWVTAEQHRRQSMVQGQVDVCITDSALPLGYLYAPHGYRDDLLSIVRKLSAEWLQLDVLLTRDIMVDYQPLGRAQDVEQACALQEDVMELFSRPIEGRGDRIIVPVECAGDLIVAKAREMISLKARNTSGLHF